MGPAAAGHPMQLAAEGSAGGGVADRDGAAAASPDYLVACRPYLGEVAAHHHRAFHERFSTTSTELGFDRTVTRLQWSALVKVTALGGRAPRTRRRP